MAYRHVPVLLNEVIEFLNPKPGGIFVDCTLGGAGYTSVIANRVGKNGQVFSFDLDEMAIKNAEEIFKKNKIKNVKLINDNFRYFKKYINENLDSSQERALDGIVFDLGLSSAQLADSSRGFSFLVDAPLAMGFSGSTHNVKNSTFDVVNRYKADKLERIIKEYGEEKYARQIARAIVGYRKKKKIESSLELVGVIGDSVSGVYKNSKKIHFATRTFQALRIETNDELGSLKQALNDCLGAVKVGGRIAVVSFHSLEDRIVKKFFKAESKDCICPPEIPDCRCEHKAKLKILTKKVITAGASELKSNPRARSAKLRVAEML